MSTERPKKLQRISQACDLCHRRSIRCRPSEECPQQQCQNCYDFQVDCTYNRPSRRRRRHSVSLTSPPNVFPSQWMNDSPERNRFAFDVPNSSADGASGNASTTGRNRAPYQQSGDDAVPPVAWRYFALASRDKIQRLLEIYMDVVYPVFPLFHGQTLWQKFKTHDHLVDRGFFASVMAACALASSRASLGSVERTGHGGHGAERQADVFSTAAQEVIPKDLTKATGFHFLRASALLALTAVQCGQLKNMHQWLGHYMTLSAIQQFHDETLWPSEISVFEREERRRLFWSMYKFDISSAAIFNSAIRFHETNAHVDYPTEVNDEDLATGLPSPTAEHSWFRGWNFTTDLCRVLEFVLGRIRRNRQRRENRTQMTLLHASDSVSETQIMDHISTLCCQLPSRFQDYNVSSTGEKQTDIFGFQAANIQASLQLVRTTLFSAKWHPTRDINHKCNVAEQVLTAFHGISPPFLQAMSMPLVYQLSTIGNILASVMEGVLTEESYSRVRTLLVSMADLLLGLEVSLQATAGASKEIRHQIQRIDQYMDAQRRSIAGLPNPLPSMDMTLQPCDTPIAAPAFPNAILNPYQQHHRRGAPVTPLDEFQLPPDLVGSWPFDFTQDVHHFFLADPGMEM